MYPDEYSQNMYMGPKYKEPPTEFDLNTELLAQLMFTQEEIHYFSQHVETIGALTENRLLGLGVAPNYAKLFNYMYRICCGKVNGGAGMDIGGYLTLSQHLKNLFQYRYLSGDPTHDASVKAQYGVTREKLPTGLFDNTAGATDGRDELPRRVEIKGIPTDSKFAVFNSDNYVYYDKLYTLKPGTNVAQTITILTDKQPELGYREKRSLEGILELKNMNKAGVSELYINRDYTQPHNVFYITASIGDMRETEHYGGIRIIAFDGTIITIRVEVWSPGKGKSKKVSNKKVYELGYFPDELNIKLQKVANMIYTNPSIAGVKMEVIEPILGFESLTEYPDNGDETEVY